MHQTALQKNHSRSARTAICLVALLVLSSKSFAQFGDKPAPPPVPTPYFDLDFERLGTMTPWEMMPSDCIYDLDNTTVSHGKQSASIAFGRPDGFYNPNIGATIQQVMPIGLAGVAKWKLEIDVDIKCDAITLGGANFYAATLHDSSKTIQYKNLIADSIKETLPWKTYKLVLDGDSSVHYLQLACMLGGSGKVWFDHVVVKVNGNVLPELMLPIVPTMSTAERTTLEKKIIPFDPSIEINDPNLSRLSSFFASHRIVGLGEATSGTHEFFTAKDKLIRYLVEKHGFSLVGIEGNTFEMDQINDYIATGKGNLDSLIKGFYYWTYITQEVRDMIGWLRSYNVSSGKHVQLFGFDMQAPYKLHDEIVRFVREQKLPDATEATHVADRFIAVLNDIEKGGTTSVDSFKVYSSQLYHLLEGDALKVRASEQLAFRHILIYADNLRQFASLVTASSSPQEVRDSCMAANIENRLLLEDPAAKCVLWSHNVHIGTYAHNMGSFLKKEFADQYLSVGFLFDDGTFNAAVDGTPKVCDALASYPGSIEYFCKEVLQKPFFLDLQGGKTASGLPKVFYEGLDHHNIELDNNRFSYFTTIIPNNYSGIIYIPKSTPSKLLKF